MRPKSLPRGLHEVQTVTGASVPGSSRDRVQAAAVVARLERERSRLEEELQARAVIQRKLEDRLKRVRRRLAAMQATLPEAPTTAATSQQDPGAGYTSFSLEY